MEMAQKIFSWICKFEVKSKLIDWILIFRIKKVLRNKLEIKNLCELGFAKLRAIRKIFKWKN